MKRRTFMQSAASAAAWTAFSRGRVLVGNIAAKLGQKLKWNAETESFVGSREANALLFREHRKPWDLVTFS